MTIYSASIYVLLLIYYYIITEIFNNYIAID